MLHSGLKGFCIRYNLEILVFVLLLHCYVLSYWQIICRITHFTLYDVKSKSKAEEKGKLPLKSWNSNRRRKTIGRDKSKDAYTFHSYYFLHKSIWLIFQWALWLPGFCLFNWLLLLCFTLLKYLQSEKSVCISGYWCMSVKICRKQFVRNDRLSALPSFLVFYLAPWFILLLYEQ